MASIRIGFVLLSPSRDPQPSTRVSVLNMLPFLRDAGFDARIAHDPDSSTEKPDLAGLGPALRAQGFDIVYFQKVRGPGVEPLAHELTAAGIPTVYGTCDVVEPGMTAATDATIVTTDYLKCLHPQALQSKIHVVHDGIENPLAVKTVREAHRGSPQRPLRAVLVASMSMAGLPILGSPPPWLHVTIVGPYARPGEHQRRLREIRWELGQQRNGERLAYLSFLLDRRIDRIAWDPDGVYEHMLRADIGIIPIETAGATVSPHWMLKSENRLTLKMAVGLPVLASPVPSYEPVIVNGVNGFLARSRDEWTQHLEALRDPTLRAEVGTRARESVLERFSKEAQARALIGLLHSLVR